MIGVEAGDFFFEIDIVAALMYERQCVDHGFQLCHGFGKRLKLYETFQVEHAIIGKIGLTFFNEREPMLGTGFIKRITVKIENVAHDSTPQIPRPHRSLFPTRSTQMCAWHRCGMRFARYNE